MIGAGAVGGVIGAELALSGQEVVFVARGPHLAAIREDGLRVATPSGTRTVRADAVGGPDDLAGPGDRELRADDVLVLAVKTQDTQAVVDDWAWRPVAGGGTAGDVLPLLCLQNGVENERIALRRFAKVLGACVLIPANHVEPGVVASGSEPVVGVLIIGPVGEAPGVSPGTADGLAADLTAARVVTTVVPDVRPWKYAKLLRNLVNAVDALSGPTFGGPSAEGPSGGPSAGQRLYAAAVAEGREVLAAAGIGVVTDAEHDARFGLLDMQEVPDVPYGGGSTWQSLARGTGRIETDYLNGEIVLLGRLHGIETPVNALLQRLAAQAARTGRPPGSVPAEEILAALG